MCFFFQAEDGIRDLYVTGVQTCALPILTTQPPFEHEPVMVDRIVDLFGPVPAGTVVDATVGGAGQDRKSTRLNSSHVEISYAVFCLKKKKKKKKRKINGTTIRHCHLTPV